MDNEPNYLNPDIPLGLKRVRIPILEANEQSLSGYGYLVKDPKKVEIEIVRWPSVGKRPVDKDSGNEGSATGGFSAGDIFGIRLDWTNSASRKISFYKNNEKKDGVETAFLDPIFVIGISCGI